MTKQEAYLFLHPDTRNAEVRRIMDMYRDPVQGAATAKCREREAILIACECICRCMKLEDDGK